MVTVRPVCFLYAAVLVLIAALCVVGLVEHRRASDLRARLTAVVADGQRSAMRNSGAVVSKDVPAPPVPSQLRDRVDAVRRAVPEAKVERTEVLQTGAIEAHGKTLPCGDSGNLPNARSGAGAPDATAATKDAGGRSIPNADQQHVDEAAGHGATNPPPRGALLRAGDRFYIRLRTVTLTTAEGAEGLVGEAELRRFDDDEELGTGAILADQSTVWRAQRPQERPRWFAVPMGGVTSRARAWAGVAIGRGRWGGVLAGAWKPGDAEVFVGGAARW